MVKHVTVIDAHTHLFPSEVIANRADFVARDAWFGALYASDRAKMANPVQLVTSMDAAGVAMSVVCGWPWRDPGLCRFHNDAMAEAAKQIPGRMAWLAIVNPADPSAPAEIERCFALGAAGVGELNADAQGFDWRNAATFREAIDLSVHLQIPWLLHCSEPVGHQYPGKGTATPDAILAFLAGAPNLTVLAAHWGGGLPFYEMMPEVASLTRNVVYDSAASTYLYRHDVFPVVSRLVTAGRVAFASDFPLLKQLPLLQKVRSLGFTERDLAEILSGTATRAFRLPVRTATS